MATKRAARKKQSCCETELTKSGKVTGRLQDEDFWTCPKCGLTYEHFCDEAEGCIWYLVTGKKLKREATHARD